MYKYITVLWLPLQSQLIIVSYKNEKNNVNFSAGHYEKGDKKRTVSFH